MYRGAASNLLALGMLFPGMLAHGENTGWGDNFDLAQSRAAKSGKDLLICFTARADNAICRQFETEFLGRPELVIPLQESFEMLWFDVASESGEDDDSSASLMLRKRYEVSAFPTVVLADSQAIPYAYTGFRPGGTKSYPDHLNNLKQRHASQLRLFKAASRAKGVEKARFLAKGIPELGGQRTAKFYGDIMREVVELDPNNESGYVEALRLELADLEYVRKMQELDQEVRWSEMEELTNAYIEDYNLTGSRKQAALMNRFDIHRRQANLRAMLTTLAQVVEINQYNHHGRQAQEILKTMTDELQMQQVLQSVPAP
ncbi:MAG: thioredoxin family protein [Verrucomicrobiota bacterium]